MNDEQFKDAVAWFRSSIRYQGDHTEIPELRTILRKVETPFFARSLRWAVVAVVALILGAIPVSYERTREQQRAAEQERQDALLLEKVNAGISRTVPRSMEPLLGLGEIR